MYVCVLIHSGSGTQYTNVAAAKYGGQCADASSSKSTCDWAIDGMHRAYDGEWITHDQQNSSTIFIKIQFDATYKISGSRIMQRFCSCEQNRDLTFEFSDGSKQKVCVITIFIRQVKQ